MHRDLRGECRSMYDGQLDLRFTGAMPIFHGWKGSGWCELSPWPFLFFTPSDLWENPLRS